MTQLPDTIIVTGPNFEQEPLDYALITPTGGVQMTLRDAISFGGNLSMPPPIGNVTPNTGEFTDITATGTVSADSVLHLSPAGGTVAHNAMNLNTTWTGISGTGNAIISLQAVDNTDTHGSTAGSSILSVNQISSSSTARGPRVTVAIDYTMSAASANVTGLGGSYVATNTTAFADNNDNGTSTGFGTLTGGSGNLYSLNSVVHLGANSTFWSEMVGYELDVVAASGSSVNIKLGLSIVQLSGDASQGQWIDNAIILNRAAPQTAGQGWLNGIMFGNMQGYFPIDPTGTMIGSGPVSSGTMLATNGIDFSLVTFSGNSLKMPGFAVSGAGACQATAGFVAGAPGAPAWTSGTGAPGALVKPKGSMYSRVDGGVGTTLYVSQGAGTWNPVAGV